MPTSRSVKYRIAITLGDPAGIGPEVTVRALHRLSSKARAQYVVLGPSSLYNQIAKKLGLRIRFVSVEDPLKLFVSSQSVPCYCPYHAEPVKKRGASQKHLTKMAVESIRLSVGMAMRGEIDAVVTAPINKAGLKKAGFDIPGHTEYMAGLSGTRDFDMMLVGGVLRVVLVTRHTPLMKVPSELTVAKIEKTIRLTERELRGSFGIVRPRIVVAGLNPHAGEEGTIGREELTKIIPAVRRAKRGSRASIVGPLSPDALFYEAYQGRYDAVVCMYHDQGLIPLKMISRGHGVNVTLGLPFVRTSPDHGTAYDIAYKFKADSGSMEEAMRTALFIAQNRRRGRA